MDDFTIRPAVDVVEILETMQSSRPLPIPHISPGRNFESGIASIDPFDATLSDEFPCPDDYFDAPEDQIHYIPSLDHDAVEMYMIPNQSRPIANLRAIYCLEPKNEISCDLFAWSHKI
jgi:hypothetical protein